MVLFFYWLKIISNIYLNVKITFMLLALRGKQAIVKCVFKLQNSILHSVIMVAFYIIISILNENILLCN